MGISWLKILYNEETLDIAFFFRCLTNFLCIFVLSMDFLLIVWYSDYNVYIMHYFLLAVTNCLGHMNLI